MYRIFVLFGALFLIMLTVNQTVSGQDKKGKKEKEPLYAVLMITDSDKSVSFIVASADEEKTLKQDLEKTYKEIVKKWEASKNEARKNKLGFSDPKPLKPKIKILNKGLKKDEAQSFKQKAVEDHNNKSKKSNNKNKSEASGKDGDDIKYAVLEIKDIKGSVFFEIIDEKKARDRVTDINKEYQAALKNYEKAKKDAKKRKAEFYETKPLKPSGKVLKRGITKDKAQEVMQKAQAANMKKKAGSTTKRKK